ncbi:transcriptional regulator [Burkholderia sp. Nafp2/4-1b]|uniref:ogr/Delta-like zinc finger family protein n=1 Tax=Burkholderia sp. Nafp2/4-1b TaxID=2116686 RepID=UPI000EF8CD1D|nr:ogr/Delta-like zinc finger family protein [Burkholderia sp. Nafp2/4-1b]RKU01807.1 transcriptional regulator [Burkholderia sp. Nafp2/4-1b]
MRILNRCPHCRTRANARSSRELSLTLREVTYQCTNVDCGHTYIVNMEFARTLSPSATPNLALKLPLSPHVRERLEQQLELPV